MRCVKVAGALLAVAGVALAALGMPATSDADDRVRPAVPGLSEERRALVQRVVDGDTLVVRVGGEEERVRLLGIDTPELPREDRRGEYLAVEAAAWVRDQVSGEPVVLSGDSQREDRDGYGRLLRYVRLPDGRLLNAELLRLGYAHVFTRYPFARKDEFLVLEAEAREKELGLWAAGGRAEIDWNLAHGVLPVRLHPTSNWSWAIEFEGWIKTSVPARDLVRELGKLRRSVERGDPCKLGDRLRDENYVPVSRRER
jgi:micrococcal nuclease